MNDRYYILAKWRGREFFTFSPNGEYLELISISKPDKATAFTYKEVQSVISKMSESSFQDIYDGTMFKVIDNIEFDIMSMFLS